MTPDPSSPDTLLRHASGLRALAHGLLADEHAAEDVVQDTWVAALERPPRHASAVGGWLRQVARRLALKRRRGEGRRTAREEMASREEALAPVDEVAEDREVLRHVVDAVLDLEEPYQSVIVMRYYQDLPPREIARRRKVSVGTVKSQLHRAQQRLRGRLDADVGGSRGQWALALASVTNWSPAPVPVVPETTGAGSGGGLIEGIAMEWKLAFGVATLAALGVTVRGLLVEPAAAAIEGEPVVLQEGTSEVQPVERNAERVAATPALAPQAQHGKRVPLGVADGASAAEPRLVSGMSAGRHEFTLAGVVVDEHDRPVAGAEIRLAPRLAPLNVWTRTDAEGRFEATWRGQEPAMDVVFGITGASGQAGLRVLEMTSGEPKRVRAALRNEHRIEIHERAADHQHPAGEAVAFGHLERVQNEMHFERQADVSFDVHVDHAGAAADAGLFRWPLGFGGTFRFATVARLRLVEEENEFFASGVILDRFGSGDSAHFETNLELVEESLHGGDTVLVTGVVRDASGQPVSLPVLVRERGESWGLARETLVGMEASAAGELRLELPRTQVELLVGGGDRGIATLALDLGAENAPNELRWNPTLDRGEEVIGRVLDPDGRPLAGWVVELLVDDPAQPWHDTTLTRADGSFAIPNVPASAARLFLRRPGTTFPVLQVADVWPGPGEHELRPSATQLDQGSLSVGVASTTGGAIDDAEVRIYHPASGRGVLVEQRDAAVLSELPVGRYRVAVGTVEHGFVDLGSVEVLAGDTTDLGVAALPERGRLSWDAVDAPGGSGWTLVRLEGGVALLVTEGGAGQPFDEQVPAGRYGLVYQSDAFSAPMIPLEVTPGGETSAAPSFEGYVATTLRFDERDEGTPFAVLGTDGSRLYEGTLAAGETGRVFLPSGEYVLETVAGDASTRVPFLVRGHGEPAVDSAGD